MSTGPLRITTEKVAELRARMANHDVDVTVADAEDRAVVTLTASELDDLLDTAEYALGLVASETPRRQGGF